MNGQKPVFTFLVSSKKKARDALKAALAQEGGWYVNWMGDICCKADDRVFDLVKSQIAG